MPSNGEEGSINYIFDTMSYGPALDSENMAKAWLANHNNELGIFINGYLKTKDSEQIQHAGVCTKIGIPENSDILKGLKAAEDAFEKWKGMSATHRANCLYNVARNIQKHQSLMVTLETIQSQRPSFCARDIGVPCLIRGFYHYAGWAHLLGNEIKNTEPFGVVAIMTEGWLSPLTSCWGIVPALAAGNTIVLVPDRRCSLSCFLFAEICLQSGLPPGAVNILPGHSDTYSTITKSLVVKKILFSGVPERARKLQRNVAGVSNNISVDTGGRPTVIVLDSADVDSAIEGIIETLSYNDCRSYCAGVRVLVQDPIYKLVVNKIEKRVDKLRIGKCLDKTIDISKICLEEFSQTLLLKCLNDAKKEGSRIHPTVDKISEDTPFPPTVISGIQTASSLLSEEVGGPILIIVPFRTTQEAVSLANNGCFISSVSIWSERNAVSMEIAYKVKSNVVWINCQNLIDSAVSYGSAIHTGISQDGGEWALLDFRKLSHQTPNSSLDEFVTTFGSKSAVSPQFEAAFENGSEIKLRIDHTYKLYYGGAQKRPDSNSSYAVHNFKSKIIGYAPDAGKKDVRNAVEAAHGALAGWSGKSSHNRAQILYYIAENLQLRAEEFCNGIAELTGKDLECCWKEVQETVQVVFHWAATCDKHRGTVEETPLCKTVMKMAEPIGIIGIICPKWNNKATSPLFSFVSLLSAAIALGNSVIIVPNEYGSLIALDMYQIFDTSDVPKGVINILTGNQDHLTRCLAEHQNLQGIWYHADSMEGAAFVTYAAAENFKHVWINPIPLTMHYHYDQIKEFLFHATKRKCIWMPSGDAFP